MNVKSMYHELLFVSLILNFFDALLTAAAIFSFGFFIVYFYRLPVLIAGIAAGAFFIRSLVRKLRQNKILVLESKYPDLKERLRTSYDYQDTSNTIINELHSDILSSIGKVDVNAFLNTNRLFLKIIVICVMMTLTLYFSSVGFDILDIRDGIMKSPAYKKSVSFVQDIFDLEREETTNRPMLDKGKLAELGNREMNMTIDSFNTELDIGSISEPGSDDFGGRYPGEIGGSAQEVYQENIPEEHKEAVKEYFKKINE